MVACGEPLRLSACHPVPGVQQAFRPRPSPIGTALGSVRRLLIHLDLPHVTHVRIRIMLPACCTAVTTP